MLDNGIRSPNGNFPNIIYKKKLAPLPLFKQNQPQKVPLTLETPSKTSPFGFGINSRSAGVLPKTMKGSPSRTFLSEFKTINNYGRLCDQAFLEFSSFHYEQVFGSGGGKKKLKLDPIQQKKDKKKIQKLGTIGLPNISTLQASAAIRVEDNSTTAANATSTFFREHQVESPKTAKTIQKAYQIGDYEARISFISIQICLVPANRPNKAPLVLLVRRDDLKKIYKKPVGELAETLVECLQANNNRISLRVGKEHAQSSRYVSETYPEKKDGLHVNLDGQDYNVTIHFPCLEIAIDALDYKEKLVMNPNYLANLFEENFDNLQDYVGRFSLPDAAYKGKEEIHKDQLKALPTIIKKVVDTTEFGGTMLFKSMEIHLKNTSEFEPQIMMHESSLTPMQRNMNKRKQKDVNNVVLRVPIDELEKILKADVQELVELMKESIVVEEGKGFSLLFDPENTKPIQHRDEYRCENFPQMTEKFNVRFNRFLYEIYIKFPTLELYVPETNFKDVIQLSPSQLQDLINNTFENMQDYLTYFRRPTSSQRDQHHEASESAENTAREKTETEPHGVASRLNVESQKEVRSENPTITIFEAEPIAEAIATPQADKEEEEDPIAVSTEVAEVVRPEQPQEVVAQETEEIAINDEKPKEVAIEAEADVAAEPEIQAEVEEVKAEEKPEEVAVVAETEVKAEVEAEVGEKAQEEKPEEVAAEEAEVKQEEIAINNDEKPEEVAVEAEGDVVEAEQTEVKAEEVQAEEKPEEGDVAAETEVKAEVEVVQEIKAKADEPEEAGIEVEGEAVEAEQGENLAEVVEQAEAEAVVEEPKEVVENQGEIAAEENQAEATVNVEDDKVEDEEVKAEEKPEEVAIEAEGDVAVETEVEEKAQEEKPEEVAEAQEGGEN